MKKTTSAKRALKHASRCTPAQLAAVLCDRTRHRPARLAKLASQLGQLADAYIERKELRRELRQRRAQPPAEMDLLQQAVAAVAHESERRAREHISLTLRLCDFPAEWADSFAPTATDPYEIARALLQAMRRTQ